jgi:uncharacterized protein (DUF302 family)
MGDSGTPTEIQHTDVATGRTYEALTEAFEQELGHLDPLTGVRLIEKKASWNEVEREMARIAGPRGLMIIFRADQGKITSLSGREKQCSLYLVGNPVIAERIISIDLRASFYVPFRVCLYDDGRPDGAVISYDRPSFFLAALGNPALTEFGALLDRKIDDVATALRKP